MELDCQRRAPAAVPPGKTRYPLYWRPGGLQGRSVRVCKISPPTGIRSPDRTARRESLYQLSIPGLLRDEELCDLYRSLVLWVIQCRLLRLVGHVGGMGRDTIDPDIL